MKSNLMASWKQRASQVEEITSIVVELDEKKSQ